jgi:polygalacturonase
MKQGKVARLIGVVGALTLTAMSALPAMAAGKVCNVRSYGAKGDGKTKDTVAIQKAIDACAAGKGGGTVVVPDGTFVTAPVLLKSNMTLHLLQAATLLGSPDIADYPTVTFARHPTRQALVSSVNAENVSITGTGTIDGNGHIWWDYVKGVPNAGVLGTDHPRPMLVVFDHSKHIRMEGVTVQNSGFWQIVPYYSDDLVFQNIRVIAPKRNAPNTDAIDPFSSSNILIDHVFASTGDDNVAIKSGEINSPGPDDPSKNIVITDCTFENGHGLSIGSEVAGGVQNVHAERIHFKGTDQGIRIKAARDRGNDVSNISYKDITMEDVQTAILITEYYPHAAPEGEVPSEPVGRLTPKFHNITIENVTATNSGSAGTIVGLPESPVLGLTMKNVHLAGKTGLTIAYATVLMDGVTVSAETGEEINVAPTANVMEK